ncbi:MAG: ATP-binding protein [Nocardioidaceae bacterium]|nr:ATP-binding protein [Nocardioidaceae bacterium]
MDPQDREFMASFKRFLDHVSDEMGEGGGDGGGLARLVETHLGVDPRGLPVVSEQVAAPRLPDVDIALGLLAARGGATQLVGATGAGGRRHTGLAGILQGEAGPLEPGPVAYANMPIGPGEERQVVSWGLHLFVFDGRPVAVLQRAADEEYGHDSASIEVLTPDAYLAGALLQQVRRMMVEHSVLRGQVMSFSRDEYESTLGGITFHHRPDVGADDVVLPDGTMDRLVRHVVDLGERRERMLAAGQHLKRGILLYGPPGTGKTLTVRHLLARTPGTTAVLLSGSSLGLVREATKIARAMQPGIVVLEDCDLIAEDREMSSGADSMLFEMLDAMDGLGGDADVTFLLTTNRADLLEEALVQRPGRVDLALEVPLPDLPARRRLFALYARGLPISETAIADAAARAEGVTASFAKELVRRAVLTAALDDRDVADADLTSALDGLLSEGEALTRSLLGSGPRVSEASHPVDGWDDDEDEGVDD